MWPAGRPRPSLPVACRAVSRSTAARRQVSLAWPRSLLWIQQMEAGAGRRSEATARGRERSSPVTWDAGGLPGPGLPRSVSGALRVFSERGTRSPLQGLQGLQDWAPRKRRSRALPFGLHPPRTGLRRGNGASDPDSSSL